MKSRLILLLNIPLLGLCTLLSPQALRADKLGLKDGTQVEGVIKKVEKGQVTVEVGQETKVFNILDVSSIEFDTLHLSVGSSRLPLQHFFADMQAQEMVSHIQQVEEAAAEVRRIVDQTKKDWAVRKTITANDAPEWEATRQRLRRALSRYQEVLGDFYFHVVGKVDEYNRLTKEGKQVRVKGRSPLISKDMEQLPLKKYVPSNWYDTIFYSGYDAGYTEGYYGARPKEFAAPQ